MRSLINDPPIKTPPPGVQRKLITGVALIALLIAVGPFLPKWLTFLITMAASHGLVSLGIIFLMRGGVVSFGQGLVFGYHIAQHAVVYFQVVAALLEGNSINLLVL